MRHGLTAGAMVASVALGAAAAADTLVLRAASGERSMTCVILEETETAYKVRVKFGRSTIPKDRVLRAQRQSTEENAALIAKWDATTGKTKPATPRAGLVEGPIPPAADTEQRQINPQALLDQYGLDGMQVGLDYQAFCPPNGPFCELVIREVAAFQTDVLGWQVDDRLLGIDNRRFPNGPRAEAYLQAVVTKALQGGTQTLHLRRGVTRLDITYGP